MERRRVVVVGGGPCGLVALKEMPQAGHDAIFVEKGAQIGGGSALQAMRGTPTCI